MSGTGHPRIVVIGSCNVDYVMKAAHLPAPGETVTNGEFVQVFGGKGANQAVAAARAGGDTAMVARVGDDVLASAVVEDLRQSGIDVNHVRTTPDTATGAALIMVDHQAENCIMVAPGANAHLTPQDIQAAEPLLRLADAVVLQFEIPTPTLYAAIDAAHDLDVPVMLNLAPAQPFDLDYLPKVTHLVVNEMETQALCGFPVETPEQVKRAADALLYHGAGMVVITLGKQGAYLATAGARHEVPAFEVEAIDTTAAGDTFCGALAVALAEGADPREAARFASAASAVSVTRMGAHPSVPDRQEIEAFLATHSAH